MSPWSGAQVTEAHIEPPFRFSTHIGAKATVLLRMNLPRLILVLVAATDRRGVAMGKSKWKLDAGGGQFKRLKKLIVV